jgi:hypothetical protein
LTSLRHRFIKRTSVKGRMPADRDDRLVGYASFCAPHDLFLKKQVLKQQIDRTAQILRQGVGL